MAWILECAHYAVEFASFSDNPTPVVVLSQGRVRSFGHVEGNWPLHVYITGTLVPFLEQIGCAFKFLPRELAFSCLMYTVDHGA